MHARFATSDDHSEVLRLAALMFYALGTPANAQWTAAASVHLMVRLGDDVGVFVVDSPDDEDRLIAVAAGSIHCRLPVPGRPQGTAGFVQWVSTDDRYRRRGASRAVMSALMAWFDAREVEVVEVHATAAGEALYRSLGFDEPRPATCDGRFAEHRTDEYSSDPASSYLALDAVSLGCTSFVIESIGWGSS